MQALSTQKRISWDFLIELSLVLFICSSPLNWIVGKALSYVGLRSYARAVCILLAYLPLAVVILRNPGRFPIDALFVYLFLIAYLGITLLLHPEYEYFYQRETYGVWDYVLRPDNGIYAYLFLRLQRDPDRLLKALRVCAYIMLMYSLYRLIAALNRGYWVISVNPDGSEYRMSYNLSFGYDTLLYALITLYAALKEKRAVDWIFFVGAVIMIFLGGSRGPILDIGIFCVIYAAFGMKKTRNKAVKILFFLIIAAFLAISYQWLLSLLESLVSSLGINSRFIKKLISGALADDSGREPIWNAAVEMIRTNPLGYGAMGTRHVIYHYVDVGHPHSIVLEILVDTGVIPGILIIAGMIARSVQIFRMHDRSKWVGIYLIFFAASCQLLLSGTLWHRMAIWAAAGISVNIALEQRAQRRLLSNGGQQNQ